MRSLIMTLSYRPAHGSIQMAQKQPARSREASADKREARSGPKPAKAPIKVPLKHLRPTQIGVGMRSVAAKRRKVRRRVKCARKLSRFLEARPIPAVRGPGNAYYIIDRHHLSMALLQNEVSAAFVEVIDDLSGLSPSRFWRVMEREGRLYPFDERGRRVEHFQFPCAISELKHDPYRDLAWSVRERDGFKKCRQPFAEFAWADFFRNRIPQALLKKNYAKAVSRAIKLAKSEVAFGLPGHVAEA